jgi:hypothetical protein
MVHQVNEILSTYHAPIERLRQKYVSMLNVGAQQLNSNQRISLQLQAFTGIIALSCAGLIIAIVSLVLERTVKLK